MKGSSRRSTPAFAIGGDTVTVSRKELAGLREDARKLQCLENAGVDNWDGFSYAMEEFYGGEED